MVKSRCELPEEMQILNKRRSSDTANEENPIGGTTQIENSFVSEVPTSTEEISTAKIPSASTSTEEIPTTTIPLKPTTIDANSVASSTFEISTFSTTFEPTLIIETESITIADNNWNANSEEDTKTASFITGEAPASGTSIPTTSVPLAATTIDPISVASTPFETSTFSTTFESTLITETENIILAEGHDENSTETNSILTTFIPQANMSAFQTDSTTTVTALITSNNISDSDVAHIEEIHENPILLDAVADEPLFNSINRKRPLFRDGASAGSKFYKQYFKMISNEFKMNTSVLL